MSAKSSINPHQMKLFMGGSEWKDSITSSSDGRWLPDLWATKLEEALQPDPGPGVSHRERRGAGTVDSLREHGYNPEMSVDEEGDPDPPLIKMLSDGSLHMLNGHHRIAAADYLEREEGKTIWIPTNYGRWW